MNFSLDTDQQQRLWRAIETASLTFAYLNIWLASPIWAPRVLRAVSNLEQETRRALGAFMRGYGSQIAALAREIAGLKGRLSFLWNSERARRVGFRQEGGVIPPQQQPASAIGNVASAHSVGQFSFVCVFVVGSVFGSLVTAGSICLGIWIGHLL